VKELNSNTYKIFYQTYSKINITSIMAKPIKYYIIPIIKELKWACKNRIYMQI